MSPLVIIDWCQFYNSRGSGLSLKSEKKKKKWVDFFHLFLRAGDWLDENEVSEVKILFFFLGWDRRNWNKNTETLTVIV